MLARMARTGQAWPIITVPTPKRFAPSIEGFNANPSLRMNSLGWLRAVGQCGQLI
jgi:hypothetical protein